MTKLNRNDRKILTELQRDGRLTNVELSERVGMSPSPCLRRVRQLEEKGYIRGYAARVDSRALGFGINAFAEVKVSRTDREDVLDRFKQAVAREPAIVGCYFTAGQFDILLRIVAVDMEEFSNLMQYTLLRLPGVADIKSSFIMEEVKDASVLPLDKV